MKLIGVLTQYGARAIARTFSYVYYGSKKIEPRFRVKINFNGKEIMGFVTEVNESLKSQAELEEELGYQIKVISEKDIIDEEPLINDELMTLAEGVSEYYMSPLISVLQAMLPKTLSPKLSSLHGPKIAYEKWVKCIDSTEDGLTAKQIEMLRLIAEHEEILKKEAGSPSILTALVEKKKVLVFSKEKNRFVLPIEERENPHEMSIEQRIAYETILSSPKEVVLLQGVTGSGKTEVYLRLSEKYLDDNKTVLMLVPEINLTPQMVEYFSRRFGPKVAILHSELTPGERYDEYRRIAQGKAQIVVGARSAIFAPLTNLGLIILDEEHVESYKQDNAPYYHAREVAIMRGKIAGCKVLLGSATPTLETKARASKGVYGYAEMRHRVNKRPLPKTSIIDLCDRSNYDRSSEKLTKPVLTAISERVKRGEQSLLLINRRGYWTAVNCPHCGYIFACPQ
ncbi:MAG: primosomal protein N', partial [Bacilli bacterium]|nr:primosomal protein N' [Bacilli bacterium]